MKKVVNILLGAILGLVAGGISVGKLYKKIVGNREEKIDKFKRYYNMLNQWLILSQQNKPLSQYFIDSGYRSIAIYGMGEMGQRLYDELKDSEIEMKYVIDREENIYTPIEIHDPESVIDGVDVVVVTAVFDYERIIEKLADKASCPIISLEDVIFSI